MDGKKIISALTLPLLLSSFLFSQSLVELAQKEKERRQRLKGKKGIVVTNADLQKFKKKPAVSVPLPPEEEQEKRIPITPRETTIPDVPQPAEEQKTANLNKKISDLEQRWEKAKEYVGLLSLKMNGLWQEFYSLDDMTSRDSIQREISETYLKLQKAKKEEEEIRKELERWSQQGKK
ncbi:MAG: hypothetical protein ACLFVG_00780 [Candidatus Aminicenantes bacterium]